MHVKSFDFILEVIKQYEAGLLTVEELLLQTQLHPVQVAAVEQRRMLPLAAYNKTQLSDWDKWVMHELGVQHELSVTSSSGD